MGKLPNGIHGHVHGKVGGVVFYTANGQNIARSLPRATRKKRKPTPLQALQRERFKVVQEWLRPLLRVVKMGFGNYAPPQTGHNAAMSYNLTHAVIYNEAESRYEINPAAFAFSGGPLPPPLETTTVQDGNLVRFLWKNSEGVDIGHTTRTILVLYHPGSNTCSYKTYGNSASCGEDDLDIRGYHLPGATCYAYMAFIDEETGAVSDSAFAGRLILEHFEQ